MLIGLAVIYALAILGPRYPPPTWARRQSLVLPKEQRDHSRSEQTTPLEKRLHKMIILIGYQNSLMALHSTLL